MNFSRRSTALATLMIVISACTFGSLSTLTVLVTREGMSLLNAMFWRYLVAMTVLLVVVESKSSLNIGRPKALRLMMVSGVGQTVITYSTLSSLRYIDVGSLAFLFYTYPAWMAVVAAIRKTEPLTLIRFLALVMALIGLVVMFGAPTAASLHPIGVIIALTAAFLYSLYLPAVESAQRGIDPMVSAFYLVAGVTITFLTLSVARGEIAFPTSVSLWRYVTLMALVCTVVAFRALIGGLRVLGPVRTSIVSTIEPFFTTLLGVMVLGDHLTGTTLLGGMLIAGAVLLLQLRDTTIVESA